MRGEQAKMTIEIDEARRQRALHPEVAQRAPSRRCTLVMGIWIAMLLNLVAALALMGLDLAAPRGLRFSMFGATFLLIAAICGGLICFNAMLADRQEYYRRGQLDGWMRGWRGQEPEVDDPLLR
jgi:hypothetical protein